MCGNEQETTDHIYVTCSMARNLWSQVMTWLKISMNHHVDTIKQTLLKVNDLSIPGQRKKIVHAIVLLTCWVLPQHQNAKVFDWVNTSVFKVVEDIKEVSYELVQQRSKFNGITWSSWHTFDSFLLMYFM
ncbi:hypothetical protein Hdeb2414_s0088g00786061 [Helianthus debilis subsp. tardiflorus]